MQQESVIHFTLPKYSTAVMLTGRDSSRAESRGAGGMGETRSGAATAAGSRFGKAQMLKAKKHRGAALRGGVVATGVLAVALVALSGGALAKSGDFGKAPMTTEGSAGPTPWERYKGWNKATWDTYNTLTERKRTPAPPGEGKVQKIAGPIEGDAENGRKLAFDRSRGGGCLACHVMGPQTAELPGNVGVDLSEVGAAGHDDEYLFNYIWDPRAYNPESVMPPWGAHGFYTEAEVRDMVAFLKTLKTPAVFKNPLDDPGKRPIPVEDRDWQDPFVNPAAEAFDTGKAVYAKAGANGKSCASCHQDAAAFKGWAVTMPKWHAGMKKVIGVEEFVARHAQATMDTPMLMQSADNITLSVYLRSLSNGMPIKVDTTSKQAKAILKEAETLMTTKVGQLNFACVDCHSPEKGALKWIRGQYLGESAGQIPHFPVWRTSRNETWDIRKRLQWCNVQVRANELPPDAPEYGVLEYYLTAQSNGMAMESPGIRH